MVGHKRLRDQLAGSTGRSFALSVAAEPKFRLSLATPTRPCRDKEPVSEPPADPQTALASHTHELMNGAFRDPLVDNYEDLIDGLQLPDPDDRHVLAAAIRCGAQVIVTWNVKADGRSAGRGTAGGEPFESPPQH